MLLEYGLPNNGVIRLTPLFPKGAELRRAPHMRHVSRWLPSATGLILGVHVPPSGAILEDILDIRKRFPWLPLVLAGPQEMSGLDPHATAAVYKAGVDRVISWSSLAPRDATLHNAWRHIPLLRLAALVHKAEHLPVAVRSMMVRSLAARHTVADVNEAGRIAGVQRASIAKIWSGATRAVPSPAAFIDWLHLLSAVVRKDSGRTWKGVCMEIGVRESKVARLGRYVLGRSLVEHDLRVRHRIFDRFLREMIGFRPGEIRDLALVASPLSHSALLAGSWAGHEILNLEPVPLKVSYAANTDSFLSGHMWML